MIPQSFLAILLNQKFTMADFSGLCVMEGKKKKRLFWGGHHLPACESYFCYEKASL